MIAYIGVLSRNDALLLQVLAARAGRILELGAGASTQIFAAYGAGTVETVETDQAWIGKTQANLAALRLTKPVTFHAYERFTPSGPYDLIFVDGIDAARREFALRTWPTLAIGGFMAFHDTRRTAPHGPSRYTDVQNVCAVVERYSPEVERVVLNQGESNTTVVTKRVPLIYEDWMKTEGRTPAQMGLA